MITSDKVLKTINDLAEIDITIKSRKRHVVWSRWIYFKITEEYTGAGPTFLGKQVNKDHATAIYGLNNITHALKVKKYKNIYENALIKLKLTPPKLDVSEFEISGVDDAPVDRDTLNIIVNKLKYFNSKELKYFLEYRVNPFIKTYKQNTINN